MKIFIAGATGVLGRRVIAGLISSNHRVVGLSRSDQNDLILNQLGAEPYRGDLFDKDKLISIVSDSEAVLHLATSIPSKLPIIRADWEANDRIRTEGTKNLIEAAVQNKCKLYIQESITALYGNQEGKLVDENSKISASIPQPAESAVVMEQLINRAINDHNLPAILLRFGTFYSYDSGLTASTFSAIQKGAYNIIGNGNVYWNLINVDDASDAVVQAVNNSGNNKGKTFNICDDMPVLYKDVILFIAKKLKARKPGTVSVEEAKQVLGSGMIEYMLTSYRCSNKRAKKELGWQPVYADYKAGYTHELNNWLSNSI